MFEHLLAVSAGAASSAEAVMAGPMAGINYSVLFGAFAGAVYYVASAADLRLIVRAAYFLVSWIVGVFGSGLAGSKLEQLLGYTDRPLDGLGAVLLSALAIKTLTFFTEQDPGAWLARLKGGFHGHK
ncbi:putative holin [Erwinia sp. MMLR14_017]|uniref:putative holin n=1 Tax=Erwinia sp. MMLR14_017 TaxID=3093842 RepID=UPI00298FAE35|nr:putative holin [Erwinia sp. MMLR14_017]MDW8847476.1 putative holin [Erwinia sp. MMLR14_017]